MGDEGYVVEKVLGKRILYKKPGGRMSTEYLVKWKDYDDPDDNTWEDEDNLRDSKNLIEEYEHSIVTTNVKDGPKMTPKITKFFTRKRKSLGQDDGASSAKRSKSLPSPPKLTVQPDSSTGDQTLRDKENVAPIINNNAFIDPKQMLSRRSVSLKFKWKNGDVSEYIPLQQAKIDHPRLVMNFIEKFHMIPNWRVYMKNIDGSEEAANGADEVLEAIFR